MTKALNINDADLSSQIGALPPVGGTVVVDEPFTRDFAGSPAYSAIYIKVGTAPDGGGTVVLEDYEGIPVPLPAQSGEMLVLAKCRRVLSAATTPKGTFTTDCENMTWLGGSR